MNNNNNNNNNRNENNILHLLIVHKDFYVSIA